MLLEVPSLQCVLSYNIDHPKNHQLSYWFHHTLDEVLLRNPSSATSLEATTVLQLLVTYSEILKGKSPVTAKFLKMYLFSWNGVHHRVLVFKLITMFGLHPFDEMQDLLLEPLRKLFFSSSVHFKGDMLTCFKDLLLNLVSVDLPLWQASSQDQTIQYTTRLPLMFDEKLKPFDALKTIHEFIKYVDRLCTVALQVEEDDILLKTSVLEFFELVSCLHRTFGLPFVFLPSPPIVYRVFFSLDAFSCSRICQIVVNYKNEFERLKSGKHSPKYTSTIPDGFMAIKQFNRYILDLSDGLWRNRAFTDSESLCYNISRPVIDSLELTNVNESFSNINHPALLQTALHFLEKTQSKDFPINPEMIKGANMRRAYLDYMSKKGYDGITTFLDNFIKKN